MKDLYKKALEAYIAMLEIHINTKTTDALFHRETEAMYEKLFETAHSIGERHVDLGWCLTDDDLAKQKQDAYALIKNLRQEMERYTEDNQISIGTEDMLWSLAGDLEDIEGTARGFIS